MAVVDDDGFLYLVDRAKDLIIVSGFNVFPAEVEEVLAQHPAVEAAAVVGVPHPHSGEAVQGLRGGRATAPTSTRTRSSSFARRHLARYKCPSSRSPSSTSSRRPAGKLLRRAPLTATSIRSRPERRRSRCACEHVNKRVASGRMADGKGSPARSPRRPWPACPSTSAACSRRPATARPRSRPSAWPSWRAFNAAKVRKDLCYLGSYGTRGVGYDVEYLLFQMSRELGLTQDWPVVIAGLGNLGHALANYGGFTERGFPVAALVDADPKVVGTDINGITVRHIDDLDAIAAEHQIAIGIIATPASAAQEVADRMIAAGVSSILNFAPTI